MKVGDLVRFTESGVKLGLIGVTIDKMERSDRPMRWCYFKVTYQLRGAHECQWVERNHLEIINKS